MYLSFNSAESLYIQACTGHPYVLGIQKKRRGFSTLSASVPYDILFSNEFLRDLGRLWSLRDIVPDPNNLPWIEKDDK